MSIITESNFPKALWPGVKSWWGLSYEKFRPRSKPLPIDATVESEGARGTTEQKKIIKEIVKKIY